MAGRKFCVQVYLLSDNLPLWVERFDRWLTGACVRAEGVFGIEDGYLVAAVRLMLRQLVSRTPGRGHAVSHGKFHVGH